VLPTTRKDKPPASSGRSTTFGYTSLERFNRTLREEALNHFVFLNAKHVLRVCREYVQFYNRARPSQALHAIPAPYPELQKPPRTNGTLVALPVLGGVQHDYRRAA